MIAHFKKILQLYTRLCLIHNLVFFAIILLHSCSNKEQTGVLIIWNNNKATGISLPKSLFNGTEEDSLAKYLKVSLLNDADSTSIFGDIKSGNSIVFEPLIPFSHGSGYEIFLKNKKIGQFNIPTADTTSAPELLTCFPIQDTVPENLLKIYLAFSHPMSEGQSDKFIGIINNERDTLHDVFLNLQPELWNEDRTVLTVWLDPGRIKRDLQPNLRLGAPLKQGGRYHLIVSRLWKDAGGLSLQKDFSRFFIVGERDSISPDPSHWKLELPAKNSKGALTIALDEPLDHFLLTETLHIRDQHDARVNGTFEIYNNDKNCRFIPAIPWTAGNYSLLIESRLEDLAGNNLNRPFDRDITLGKTPSTKDVYERRFEIAE